MLRIFRLTAPLLFVALLSWPTATAADAQRRGAPHPPPPPRPPAHGVVIHGEVFIGGYFYDPVWGPYPWWPRPVYPRYFPVYDYRAEVRLQVKPRDAAVYVDGFYAGIVDDFDGVFQRLPLPPGGHEFVLYLEGYRTARYALYLRPGSEFNLHHTMLRLPPGAASEPPPFAPSIPPPPPGSFHQPATTPPVSIPPAPQPPVVAQASGFGTLDLHVQPATAELTIDGQRWLTSDAGHFLVQLPAGAHHVEVSKDGYRRFAIDLAVRDAETAPLNVSLMQGTP
jgi:hypothetical protein